MTKAQKEAILAGLEQMYPEAKAELVFSNPYEMLVATILSAQCTDKQVNKVTPAVFARYPDAVSMADARVEDLYPMVKSCGFKTKAGNIIAACVKIRDDFGGRVPDDRAALRPCRASDGKQPMWCFPMPSVCPPSRSIPMFSGSATGSACARLIPWRRPKGR